MENPFTVHLDVFDGPFDVLLSMLTRDQLEITTVSLSLVTNEFIDYVGRLGLSQNADVASEFLYVASVLIEAKSAALLPSDLEDASNEELLKALQERDLLFARLLQYRAFKEAAGTLGGMLEQNIGQYAHHGEYVPMDGVLPSTQIDISLGDFASLAFAVFMNAPRKDVQVEQLHVPLVDLNTESVYIAGLLQASGKQAMSFSQLVADSPSREHVVARFLAVLLFFKRGLVQFKQSAAFGELLLRWAGDIGADTSAIEVMSVDFN